VEKLTLTLTNETEIHNKYDDGCAMCRPDLRMVRKLACEEYQVTKATISGGGMNRKLLICDICVEDAEKDKMIDVVRAGG